MQTVASLGDEVQALTTCLACVETLIPGSPELTLGGFCQVKSSGMPVVVMTGTDPEP